MKIKTSFVAADGVEFQTREECLRYEGQCREYKYREKYYDILCEINYMKQKDFKSMDRKLAEARDAYRTAMKDGVAGSKKLMELRSDYVYAKNLLNSTREMYGIKRKDLERLGVRLGFRKPVLRAQKEKQVKGGVK